jgi:hypothetical protein
MIVFVEDCNSKSRNESSVPRWLESSGLFASQRQDFGGRTYGCGALDCRARRRSELHRELLAQSLGYGDW